MTKFLMIFLLLTNCLYSQWDLLNCPHIFDNTGVFFANDSIGFVISESNLFKTTNGGSIWREIKQYGLEKSIYFIDENIGFIAADDGIRKTVDGGETWSTQNPYESIFEDIKFVTRKTGFASGFAGHILKTTDQGITWSKVSPPDQPITFYTLSAVDSLVCFVFGSKDTGYKTIDGGINWLKITTGTGLYIIDSFFLDSKTGYVIGAYSGTELLKTSDGGSTWEPLLYSPEPLKTVFFTDNNTGYIGGGSPYDEESKPLLWKTYDGGQTWHDQNPVENADQAILSIFFKNNCTGYAVGERGLILKTINGGDSLECKEDEEIPRTFGLFQNYPNPFNSTTTITYHIKESGQVLIEVFDIAGRTVRTIVNEYKESGIYKDSFNGDGLASGLYIYRIMMKDFSTQRKMLLIK